MRYRFNNPNKIEIDIGRKENIFIPSKLYTLSNKNLKHYEVGNTNNDIDEKKLEILKEVINSITITVGHCYTNCENFIKRCEELKLNIKYTCQTGWLFIGNIMPIHHCWIVLGEDKILDFSVSEKELEFQKNIGHLPLEVQRKLLLAYTEKEEKQPNVERVLIGKVPDNFLYVGSHSSPNMGRKLYRDLVSKNGAARYDQNLSSDPNHFQKQYFSKKLNTTQR